MVWMSAYEPVAVGDATFHGLIAATAARRPGRVAIDGLTYAQLAGRVERVAATLAARGLGPGDVLAIKAPNMAPWAGTALAAMAVGAAVTGIHPLATPEEVERQIADSGAAPLIDHFDESLLEAVGPAPAARVSPHAPALLPFSSGTSGLPKGVVLTHANLVTAVRQVQRGLRLTPDDVIAVLAPLHHVMGFVVTLGCGLAAGARLKMLPRFDPATFVDDVQDVTVLIVPPPVLGFLVDQPRELPAAELIVTGGAPVGAPLQRAAAERFPHAVVGQGYGLTETTAVITIPDRRLGTAPGSAGRIAPNTELRVADGELLVRGPQTMRGYLRDPAELIDADGWVHTGDLGRVEDGGDVFVVDRLKELIKVNAHQVAPAELEAVLSAHPAVVESAVVGRPDERRGEVPVAFVVARGEVDGAALMAWLAARVAPHKRLHDVVFVDRLPRTPAGKILRRALQPSYV
jgi:acyl-CoA synthetase (AMP-forming)/AMP-acid ligase II